MNPPLRVLYVEDDAADADLARHALARLAPHCVLTLATTLQTALARLASPPLYDLVLSDLNLPDGSGLDLLAHIRDRALPLAVVILTGGGDQGSAVAALKAGADDYLVKRDDYLERLPQTLAVALARFRDEAARKARSLRVLYAEHSASDSDLTRRHLAQHAAHIRLDVVCAATEILARLVLADTRAPPCDVLLLDYNLPGLDALELIKVLRDERGLDLPVVLVAGHGSEEAAAQALRLGVSDYLVKHPGYLLELPAILEKAHHQAELAREQAALRASNRRYDELTARIPAGVYQFRMLPDGSVQFDYVSARWCVMNGLDRAAVLADAEVASARVHPEDRPAFDRLNQAARQHPQHFAWEGRFLIGGDTRWMRLESSPTRQEETGYWCGEIWSRRKNGELYPLLLTISTVRDDQGAVTHYVGVFTDLSQIKHFEARLEHLVHYDPLTELPNRLLAQSRLAHAVEQAQRHGHRVGVLLVDLDQFKTVNDSLGHPVGDQLLQAIAQRLRERLRAEDTLARLGGDEFLLVLEYVQRPEEVASVAQAIIRLLEQPFVLANGQDVYVSVSIGLSLYPTDGHTATELVQHADAAVFQAKAQGRKTYRFYTEALTRAAHERLGLEGRLRRALERDEFVLHYQPLVSVTEGRIVGVEALVRWQPPGEALVPPMRFIPLAEETGLIVPLGAWVLRAACAQAKVWLEGGRPLLLAVNLSARQFQQQDLPGQIGQVLAATGLPAAWLELEITESTLMEQGQQALDTLAALKALGVRLAIDDFGTGYSSLAYLRRFPLGKLKIDQGFVRDIPQDHNAMEIAAAIIALARNLRLEVLAEGVETAAQLAFLREQGCDTYQGYLCSRPVPAAEIAALLRA